MMVLLINELLKYASLWHILLERFIDYEYHYHKKNLIYIVVNVYEKYIRLSPLDINIKWSDLNYFGQLGYQSNKIVLLER